MIVRSKLRAAAPPITRSLHLRILEGVVSALLPAAETNGPLPGNHPPYREMIPGIPAVSGEKMAVAIVRLQAKNTTSGPDDISGRAWVLVLSVVGDWFRGLFTACLETGRFSQQWRQSNLILLRKEGRPVVTLGVPPHMSARRGGQTL